MIALISDIHSNIEALDAVLGHISTLDVEHIYCLGDVIGYGPNPRECLTLVKDFAEFTLLGNHEEAIMFVPEDFNVHARQAVIWTKDTLNSPQFPREENRELWNYIDSMIETKESNGHLFVHGSPRLPTREYVMPKDALDAAKMAAIFKRMKRYCFVGHTHVPGVFTPDGKFYHPSQFQEEWELKLDSDEKLLFNIGSVGQPRDQDVRASYVTIEGPIVRWHRVKYDYITTMKKIRAEPGLPDFLADRLAHGK